MTKTYQIYSEELGGHDFEIEADNIKEVISLIDENNPRSKVLSLSHNICFIKDESAKIIQELLIRDLTEFCNKTEESYNNSEIIIK